MASVQLADGYQVHGRDEDAEPTRNGDRVKDNHQVVGQRPRLGEDIQHQGPGCLILLPKRYARAGWSRHAVRLCHYPAGQ